MNFLKIMPVPYLRLVVYLGNCIHFHFPLMPLQMTATIKATKTTKATTISKA